MANMHPHANANGGNIILGFGILTFVASVANILRFWARRLIHLKPGLDDYLSALLLLFNYGLLVITIFSVVLGGLGAGSYGLGEEERVEEIANLFKVCDPYESFLFEKAPLWLISKQSNSASTFSASSLEPLRHWPRYVSWPFTTASSRPSLCGAAASSSASRVCSTVAVS